METRSSPAWAKVAPDAYEGVVLSVNTDILFDSVGDVAVAADCSNVFLEHTKALLHSWRSEGVRGVWMHAQGGQEHQRLLVASWAAQVGLSVHRTSQQEVVCSCWLPEDEPNVLPRGSTHVVAVCGLVVSPDDRVLVIREKWPQHPPGKLHPWKLPGGVVDAGERLSTAAQREVMEETGLQAHFSHVLMLRHFTHARFGCGDLYAVCVLTLPAGTQVAPAPRPCPQEIDDAQWVPLHFLLRDSSVHPLNRQALALYLQQRTHLATACGVLRELAWVPPGGPPPGLPGHCDVYTVAPHTWSGLQQPPGAQEAAAAAAAASPALPRAGDAPPAAATERAAAAQGVRVALSAGVLPHAWHSTEVASFLHAAEGGQGGGRGVASSTTISSMLTRRRSGDDKQCPPAQGGGGFWSGVAWGVALACVAVGCAVQRGWLKSP